MRARELTSLTLLCAPLRFSALLCAPLRASLRVSTNICIWCHTMCLIIRWINPRALRHYGLRPRIYICSRPGHYCNGLIVTIVTLLRDCYYVTNLRLRVLRLDTSPRLTASSSSTHFGLLYLLVINAFHCLFSV